MMKIDRAVPPKRLLVIDDERAMGDFVGRVAASAGFAVEIYSDPRCFQEAVLRADPDVIILDLAMPGVDGIEMLRFLADIPTRASVFIFSGIGSTLRDMGASLGAAYGLAIVDVIPKPVRAAELRRILSSLAQAGGP